MLATSACSLMPRELNLTPLWFHRLDADGELLECDALWPIVHYERTPEGGDDFRIRPLYRRVTEPEPQNPGVGPATEHQFLVPFGRVRSDATETSHRLFPIWNWRARSNENGERDVDWYFLFPLIWGGASADGREDYFAFLPFYADIPQFLSYDRFLAILFPLYLRLDKEGHRHHSLLWPFLTVGSCAENGHRRFLFYPFYGHDIDPGFYDRRFLLWPFFAWSTENMDTDSPVDSYWFWPLCGFRTGREVGGWSVLWPLFSHVWKQEHLTAMHLLWPLFHYYWNRAEDNVTTWWLWPLFSRTVSDDQDAWGALWPLVWWRSYDDPDGRTSQQWVLPFFWHIAIESAAGGGEEHTKIWPLWHRTTRTDAAGNLVSGDWSLLSPLPVRGSSAAGIAESYGFLWEIATSRQRGPADHSVDVLGRVFTHRERDGESTASMPFLFNYERDASGSRTLRLFQFLPIPLGGGSPEAEPTAAAAAAAAAATATGQERP
ncbi:MAG: hypothetical protein KDC98_00260 [Planctomycetes bacterium]|nr:hypothetical protein [Planctomycetota bacterium]